MAVVQEVDEDALREKWARVQQGDALTGRTAQQQTATVPAGATKEQKEALDRLATVKICQQCQAHGIIKRQYGHRVMDEICAACDGEGCIITKPPTQAEKIAKVEALIASAEDLESAPAGLQRYEDALRSGDLDSVLTKQ